MNDAVLRASGLGKEYRLYPTPARRLAALLGRRAGYHSHWALRGVDFELARGQCLGLVGDNGAGKSTLLKLLAGTIRPSTGTLWRVGRVTAILELGAGFHPEFTGRENLYFGGSLIGIDAAHMQALQAQIIDFAELAGAIDRPVKTYSSGMVVRLAFALVTALAPDVLIIDEALAVGDQHFQKKCVERIEAFRRAGCTILFCSHSLYHVRQLCDVVLWLDQGRARAFGPTEAVLASYESHVRAQDAAPAPALPAETANAADAAGVVTGAFGAAGAGMCLPWGLEQVAVRDLPAPQAEEGALLPLLPGPDLVVTVRARAPAHEPPSVGLMLEQVNGVGITSMGTHIDGVLPTLACDGCWTVTLTIPDLPLHTGEFKLSAYLFDARGLVVYDERKDCAQFRWVYPTRSPGLVRLPHRWS